jgi:predicted Zn-dependent peptidase
MSLAAPPAPKPIQIPIRQYKLDNGLRVVMSEDHSAPTFSLCVTYNTGSHNEKAGRTGFAHLFEHMMFQGSENVGKGEHMSLVLNNGGDMNGTTSEDRTNYFESFPANQIDLGLFLESDRMRSLAINQANLDNQRATVQEERRQSVDNQPYGKSEELLQEVAFDNFANLHSVIGSMEDLNAATLKDVQDFFRIYYAPNNAVLALVGDFKSDEMLAKVKKYFGAIPSQPPPPVPDLSEKPQNGERRRTVEDPFAQIPRIDIAFRIPPGNTPDWYANSVLASVLGGGQSSRLYQVLVKEKELAVNVQTYAEEHRGPGLFQVIVSVRPGKDFKEVEKVVYEQMDKLKTEPIADWELDKVRMSSRRRTAGQLEGTLYRAILLAQDTVYYDDPNVVNEKFQKLEAVTKDDIQRVARKYLVEDSRTVVTTIPKPKSAKGASAAPDKRRDSADLAARSGSVLRESNKTLTGELR